MPRAGQSTSGRISPLPILSLYIINWPAGILLIPSKSFFQPRQSMICHSCQEDSRAIWELVKLGKLDASGIKQGLFYLCAASANTIGAPPQKLFQLVSAYFLQILLSVGQISKWVEKWAEEGLSRELSSSANLTGFYISAVQWRVHQVSCCCCCCPARVLASSLPAYTPSQQPKQQGAKYTTVHLDFEEEEEGTGKENQAQGGGYNYPPVCPILNST